MTTLCFNSVENDPFSNLGCSPEEKRIQQLRTQILDYGVEQKYMFTVDDVFQKKNTPKVIRCLEEVAKLVKWFSKNWHSQNETFHKTLVNFELRKWTDDTDEKHGIRTHES